MINHGLINNSNHFIVLKVYFKEYKWDALDQRVELPLPLPRRQKVMLINLLKLKLHLNNNLPETPMLEK